jgi:hypothetical protein
MPAVARFGRYRRALSLRETEANPLHEHPTQWGREPAAGRVCRLHQAGARSAGPIAAVRAVVSAANLQLRIKCGQTMTATPPSPTIHAAAPRPTSLSRSFVPD